MYKHSRSYHINLFWPDQSLDGDWEEKPGLPFKADIVGGFFTHWHPMWKDVTKSKSDAKTPGIRMRLNAVGGLGHSPEAKIKSGAP